MAGNDVHELTAAYAVNALDDADEAEYEAHLGRCPSCQRELASLQEAAASLAYATDAPAASPALRDRILAQARSERENVVPLRPRWSFPTMAAAAVAATVALALGAWAVSLSSALEDERAARTEQERALAVLAHADAERIPLRGAEGTLVVAPTGDAALVVANLDDAPENKTYEAWIIEEGKPVPAGLFDAGEPRTVVALSRPVPDGAMVAVTLEDEDGAEQPTTAPLFNSESA